MTIGNIQMKKLFYFSLAVLLAILLSWFGSRLLSISGDALGSTEQFILGVFLVLGSIGILSPPDDKKDWIAGLSLLGLGIYAFARASGTIEAPWLARIIGIAAWAAAAFLIYIAWPTRHGQATRKDNDANGE